jgi:hypothetical protein
MYTIEDGRLVKIIGLLKEAAKTYDELPAKLKNELRDYPVDETGGQSLPVALRSALTVAIKVNAERRVVCKRAESQDDENHYLTDGNIE